MRYFFLFEGFIESLSYFFYLCILLEFVYNKFDQSYETLLTSAKCKPIWVSRMQRLAVAVFKCVHRLSPEYINDMFKVNRSGYNLRNPHPLEQRQFQTITHGYRSFSYMGSKLWNELPNDIKHLTSLEEFRGIIKRWDGPSTCDRWF